MTAPNNNLLISDKVQEIVADAAVKEITVPFLQKVGRCLEPLLDVVQIKLNVIKFKANINAQIAMRAYIEKVSKIEDAKITPVPLQLGSNILEELPLIEDDNLRKFFVEILYKASHADFKEQIHPRFVADIKKFSPQEAQALDYLRKQPLFSIYYLKPFFEKPDVKTYLDAHYFHNSVDHIINIHGFKVVMDCLISSGIYELKENWHPLQFGHVQEIRQQALADEGFMKTLREHFGTESDDEIQFKTCRFVPTGYGEMLIRALGAST